MALLAWIGKRLHDRVDQHEREHVTREELTATITQFREDRKLMHEENRENLQYIRERVDTIVDRQR